MLPRCVPKRYAGAYYAVSCGHACGRVLFLCALHVLPIIDPVCRLIGGYGFALPLELHHLGRLGLAGALPRELFQLRQ